MFNQWNRYRLIHVHSQHDDGGHSAVEVEVEACMYTKCLIVLLWFNVKSPIYGANIGPSYEDHYCFHTKLYTYCNAF